MDIDRINTKRRRTPSPTPSSSSSTPSHPSRSPSPTTPPPKYHRSSPSTLPLTHLCTLPPTCSQPGTSSSYATLDQLERHQEVFHKWVCRTPIRDRGGDKQKAETMGERMPEGFTSKKGGVGWKECGKVFPEERLLVLHQAETHDPIMREKQSRGDKIFQCFLPVDQCQKVFATPTKRRQHLIDKHRYPREYFFSVTNHGINQIAQEDGLAISLIRPRKDRSQQIHTNQSPVRHSTSLIPDTSQVDTKDDVDMDRLIAGVEKMESSLTFVPRGIRKKKGGESNAL